jgi:hypothetical protein
MSAVENKVNISEDIGSVVKGVGIGDPDQGEMADNVCNNENGLLSDDSCTDSASKNVLIRIFRSIY